MFHIGDTVRVVAGPYLGVEGHIIQMEDDVFRLCQNVSKEEVRVFSVEHRAKSSNTQV